jgi:hypothetical protein
MYPAYGVTFNVVPDSEVWAPSVSRGYHRCRDDKAAECCA